MGSVLSMEIFSEKEWRILKKELGLSHRQSEVIKYLFRGFSDKQISKKLGIAVPTVRTHLTRLFSRFHLQDRSELILYVFGCYRKWCINNSDGCKHWLANFR